MVRHSVSDYDAWRKIYEDADTIRAAHGCTAERVLRAPGDTSDLLILHEFPSVEQAEAFAANPDLRSAMEQAGVVGAPRIEIFESA